MAWYLKWPASTGNTVTNNKLVQISGITGNLVSVKWTLAENMPAYISNVARYLFDIRRLPDNTNNGGGVGYLLQNDATGSSYTVAGTSNWKIDGINQSAAALFTARDNQLCEFDVGVSPSGGCIAFGARFNETESVYGMAIKNMVIVDAGGSHVIDMSASGGSLNTFKSTDGAITLKLINFSGGHWIFYDDGSSIVSQQLAVPVVQQASTANAVWIAAAQPALASNILQLAACTVSNISTLSLLTVQPAAQPSIAIIQSLRTLHRLVVAQSAQIDRCPRANAAMVQRLAIPVINQSDLNASVNISQSTLSAQAVIVPGAKQAANIAPFIIIARSFLALPQIMQNCIGPPIGLGLRNQLVLALSNQQGRCSKPDVNIVQKLIVQPSNQMESLNSIVSLSQSVPIAQLINLANSAQAARAGSVVIANRFLLLTANTKQINSANNVVIKHQQRTVLGGVYQSNAVREIGLASSASLELKTTSQFSDTSVIVVTDVAPITRPIDHRKIYVLRTTKNYATNLSTARYLIA